MRSKLSYYGNQFIKWVHNTGVNDHTIAYRGISKEALEQLDLVEKNGNAFYAETIIKAKRKGMKITEIETDYRNRLYGESKNNQLFSAIEVLMMTIRIKVFGK